MRESMGKRRNNIWLNKGGCEVGGGRRRRKRRGGEKRNSGKEMESDELDE